MPSRHVLRGTGALLALLALVVGVPAALIALVGNPLPGGLDALAMALASPDLGGSFLMGSVLPCLAWAFWLYLLGGLFAELFTVLRHGRRGPRATRRRGPSRQLASSLIAAVAVMIGGTAVVGPAHAAAPPPIHDGPSITASVEGDQDEATIPDDAESSHGNDAPSSGPVVTVREGDSLWSIAETYLGAGHRYPEVADLNIGVPQADGDALADDLWLTPGWQIALPEDAAAPDEEDVDPPVEEQVDEAEAETGAEPEDQVVTVAPGDTLWHIAQAHLGDGERFEELATASGISDPSLIRPGDQILIPAGEPGTETTPGYSDSGEDDAEEHAPPTPAPGETPEESVHESEVEPTFVTPQPVETAENDDAPGPSLGSSESENGSGAEPLPAGAPGIETAPVDTTSAAADAGADQADAELHDEPQRFDAQTIGGIGGALAAGLLAWVAIRRTMQRRRRRAGERIAMPDESAFMLETQLRAVGTTEAVLRLDQALRSLAAHSQDSGDTMPRFLVARVEAHSATLYLDEPDEAPAPFVHAVPDGSAWTIEFDQLPVIDREPSAPCPAFVSIGQDPVGAQIFVDLEQLETLGIQGEPSLVRDALLALSLDLSTSTWGDGLCITLVGFDEQLDDTLSTGRLRHVSDLDALEAELRASRRHLFDALDSLGEASTTAARTAGPDAEAWGCDVVLAAPDLDESDVQRLAEIASDASIGGLAIVGVVPRAGWRLVLHAHDDATLELPGADDGLALNPQLVTPPDYGRLVEIARVTADPALEGPIRPGDNTDWTLALDPERSGIPSEMADEEWDADISRTPSSQDRDDARCDPIPLPEADLARGPEMGSPAPTLMAPVETTMSERSDADATLAAALDSLAPEIDDARRRLEAPASGDTGRLRRRRASDAAPQDRLDDDARQLVQSLGSRPWVRLLGTVELRNAAGPPPTTPQTNAPNASTMKRATELVAFLAHRPGASTEEFHAAFWPGKDPRGKTAASNRNGLTTRTRKWLGSDNDGLPHFPHADGTGYRLGEQVTSDWRVFLTLIGDDLGRTSTARLRAALDLVHGPPISGVKERSFGWAEVTRMEMLATIGDACHELAARALRAGDVGSARTSAALGREIDPVSELAWRDALQAELLAGDRDGFERVVTHLQQQLDDFEDGYEPEPETQAIIDAGRADLRRSPTRAAVHA